MSDKYIDVREVNGDQAIMISQGAIFQAVKALKESGYFDRDLSQMMADSRSFAVAYNKELLNAFESKGRLK